MREAPQWEKETPSDLGEDRGTNVLITAVNIIQYSQEILLHDSVPKYRRMTKAQVKNGTKLQGERMCF